MRAKNKRKNLRCLNEKESRSSFEKEEACEKRGNPKGFQVDERQPREGSADRQTGA